MYWECLHTRQDIPKGKVMVNIEKEYVFRPKLARVLITRWFGPIYYVMLLWVITVFIDYLWHGVVDFESDSLFFKMIICIYTFFNLISVLSNRNKNFITLNPTSITKELNTDFTSTTTTIPLDEIDPEKLVQKTFWEKITFRKVIQGKDKDKIVINWVDYSPEQTDEIIQTLLAMVNAVRREQLRNR
jgi:hypothetical protein